IDRQLAILEARPDVGLVYGQIYGATQSLAIDRGRVFPRVFPTGDVYWTLVAGNFIPSDSVFLRRTAIESVGSRCGGATAADGMEWDPRRGAGGRQPLAALPEPVSVSREPALWSNQGSSGLADSMLFADGLVLERCAQSPRARANPRAFRSAARLMRAA